MIIEKDNLRGSIVCLKLNTMEEVVGKLVSGPEAIPGAEKGKYTIRDPKKVVVVNKNEKTEIFLGPYILANSKLDEVVISSSNVVSISKASEDIEELHKKSVEKKDK